ncbi:MAG: AAA family ATPase [Treponema sp.]|jgi:hypothetical protein|nr:AAA family ATPase [Treponema sp.]
MKTLAVSNMKGGVGKSSLSAALAAELADVLFEKKTIEQAIAKTRWPGLYIVPSFGLGGELKVFAEPVRTEAQLHEENSPGSRRPGLPFLPY